MCNTPNYKYILHLTMHVKPISLDLCEVVVKLNNVCSPFGVKINNVQIHIIHVIKFLPMYNLYTHKW